MTAVADRPAAALRAPEEASPSYADQFLSLLEEVVRLAAAQSRPPLEDVTAGKLRAEAEASLESVARDAELLHAAARPFEVHLLHALAFGFALRRREHVLAGPAALAPKLSARIRAAAAPAHEATAFAREAARPYSREQPQPVLVALFSPGLATWNVLEAWVQSAAQEAARARLRAALAAVGVPEEPNVGRALGFINARAALRFGYALAACEPEVVSGG